MFIFIALEKCLCISLLERNYERELETIKTLVRARDVPTYSALVSNLRTKTE